MSHIPTTARINNSWVLNESTHSNNLTVHLNPSTQKWRHIVSRWSRRHSERQTETARRQRNFLHTERLNNLSAAEWLPDFKQWEQLHRCSVYMRDWQHPILRFLESFLPISPRVLFLESHRKKTTFCMIILVRRAQEGRLTFVSFRMIRPLID